jgi:5-methylcytosine-specific restriction endonuclease McrA
MKKQYDPIKEFNGWLRNVLRKAFYRSKARTTAFKMARLDRGLYNCAKCHKIFGCKEIKVDHITPVIEPRFGFVNWDTYISRLFCDASNLQILCDQCHRIKTNEEDLERRKWGTGRFSAKARQKNADKRKANVDLCNHLRTIAGNGMKKGHKDGPCLERRIPIIATNLKTGEIKEFTGGLEAATILGIQHTNIVKILKGIPHRLSAKGWTFKYKIEVINGN